MPENKKMFYSAFNAVVIIGGIVLAYGYLDWGFWQTLGAIFVMLAVFEVDESGPIWRRWTWSLLCALLMVLGHFYLDDSIITWGLVLLSVVMLLIILAIFGGIMNYKTGDGSTITFYIIGLLVTVPIAGVVIYKAVVAFGYL